MPNGHPASSGTMLAGNDGENVESLKGYQVPFEDDAMVALVTGSRD